MAHVFLKTKDLNRVNINPWLVAFLLQLPANTAVGLCSSTTQKLFIEQTLPTLTPETITLCVYVLKNTITLLSSSILVLMLHKLSEENLIELADSKNYALIESKNVQTTPTVRLHAARSIMKYTKYTTPRNMLEVATALRLLPEQEIMEHLKCKPELIAAVYGWPCCTPSMVQLVAETDNSTALETVLTYSEDMELCCKIANRRISGIARKQIAEWVANHYGDIELEIKFKPLKDPLTQKEAT